MEILNKKNLDGLNKNPLDDLNNRIGGCIPYDQLTYEEKELYIEPGVKNIVEVINLFEGINTFASCEGHEKRFEYEIPNSGYVAFTSKNEKSLKCILNKITHFDFEFNIEGEKKEKQYIKANCDISFNKLYNTEIHYCIRCSSSKVEFIHNYFNELARAIKEDCILNLENVICV